MSAPLALCFESKRLLRLFEFLWSKGHFPDQAPLTFTPESLILTLFPDADWVTLDLSDPLLKTLWCFYASLLLRSEDISYALSCISTHSQSEARINVLLRKHEEMGGHNENTLWHRIYDLIELFRTNREHRPLHSLLFVPEPEGSQAFLQLSESYALAGPDASHSTSFSQLAEHLPFSGKPILRPAAAHSAFLEASTALERLSEQAARHAKRNQFSFVMGHFSLGELAFCKSLLVSHGVNPDATSYATPWESPPERTPATLASHCAAIRRHSPGVQGQLQIDALLQQRDLFSAPPEQETLQAERTSYVPPPEDNAPAVGTTGQPTVYLLPYLAFPLVSRRLLPFYYESHGKPASPYDHTCLTPLEWEMLAKQGLVTSFWQGLYSKPAHSLNRDSKDGGFRSRWTVKVPLEEPETRYTRLKKRLHSPSVYATESNDEPLVTHSNLPAKLSATQLETYAACPLKYQLSYVLSARPPRSAPPAFPLLYGRIVHATLARIFQEISAPLTEEVIYKYLAPDAIERHFAFSLNHVEAVLKMPGLYLNTAQKTEALLLCRSVSHFILPLELSLLYNFGVRRILALEQSFSVKKAGIELHGVWDRLDQKEDGSVLILDYKTGNVTFTPKHMGKGENIQSLFYWIGALEHYGTCAGILFYDLKLGELKRGIVHQDALLSTPPAAPLTRGHILSAAAVDELVASGWQKAYDLNLKRTQGAFTPTPSLSSCRSCDYRVACPSSVRAAQAC